MKEENNKERTGLEIAVIGMTGRFPGANNIEQFWENLKNGVESISFFSQEELEKNGFSHQAITNPAYVKAKGIIENVRDFDASFFDYTNREAETLDPQTRIFHECVWETLENAGYDPQSYDGHIGLFAGANTNTYWESLCSVGIEANMSEQFAVSTLYYKDFLPSRVSYKLGLKGTTFFLYTACSTSLAAIHLACNSLLGGECEMAVAGGISIILPEKFGYLYEDGMILSNDGHNRAFDDRATGSPFGDGVGTVLLKRLEDAVNDGDNILAVIKGSAINNDGNRKLGYTAPSVEGQADVIRAAIHMAEVEPGSIGYIEAHGTATSLGDVVEMEALNMAFENLGLEKASCPIGALKSNIGHLNTAAGIAGFIKTVLALKYKLIPPNLHFETANSRIDFANSPFYVNTRPQKWEVGIYPRRAGVSAFGIGGTNIHLILEEWPEDTIQTTGDRRQRIDEREYQLILLSAKTQSALDNMTKNLAEHFKKNLLNRDNHGNSLNPGLSLADAAYTLQVGRRDLPYRRMTVCSGLNEAVHILSQEENDKQPAVVSRKLHTVFTPGKKKVVIFMFAGLGDQYVNMGRQLYEKEALFRKEMDRCFELLKPLTEIDIKEILYPRDWVGKARGESSSQHPTPIAHHPSPGINQPEIAPLTVFIIEYALARLLMSWGIEPKAMIGYSLGEYAAACIAGVLSLEHALKLLVSRGRLISGTLEGAMTSVPLPVEKLKPFMDERLAIAIDNGVTCIVAGETAVIEAFEEKMKKERLICVRLATHYAIHSPLMEPILAEFQQAFYSNGITLNKPQIPYISNITGDWIKEEETRDNRYWVRHLRETVQYSEGLNRLLKKDDAVFMEIGPGRALNNQLKQQEGKDTRALVTNCLKHPGEAITDEAYLLNRIGHLWLWGIKIDWRAYYNNETRRRVPLPTYPFERQTFWKEAAASPRIDQTASPGPSKLADISRWFYRPAWKSGWLPEPDREPTPLRVLLFVDDCGQGLELGQRLQKQGHHITFVKKGPSFTADGGTDTFTITPGRADHYDMLLKNLQEKQKVPQRIIHLWGVTGSRGRSMDSKAINDFLETGFYSLLYLAKAIGNQNLLEEIQFIAITDNLREVTGQEILQPEKAVISAACKVISQEYTNIACRDIDIILPGTSQKEKLLRQLSAELYIESTDTVAYRGNYRWTRVYEPILLPESLTRFSRLKQGGVYLITGGLGGIGFVLARYLARQYRAKLILTGRTVLPPREQWEHLLSTRPAEDPVNRKIRKLQELEALGAELLAFSVDAADEAGMRQAIAGAEERLGPIAGVIHTAGHVERGTLSTISDINVSQAQLHFQAKLHGLLVLKEIFADREKPLDFCLLMSSISAVLGGLGLAAYAAANSFMDAFVYRQNRQNRSQWISVNWDGWRTPDIPDHEGFTAAAWEDFAMSPEEGIAAVQRILSMDDPIHVVHSTGDLLARIKQWLSLESLRKTHFSTTRQNPSTSYPRPTLSTPYMAPRNKLERRIAGVWQKFLGIGQVGTDDNFFDLNATSLDIVRVNSILRDVLKEDIPVITMFNYPTIGLLARFLSRQETGEAIPQEEMNREVVIAQSQDRMKKMRDRHVRKNNG